MTDRDQGTVSWESPSNIALIKYWGKKGPQLPSNPSLSMTLSSAYTRTRIDYRLVAGSRENENSFLFEGKSNIAFANRVSKFLDALSSRYPFLNDLELQIESRNTFPHSSGIASSASAMSALALCICSINDRIGEKYTTQQDFYRDASYIARMGSGSACRSLYGGFVLWGESAAVQGSSDHHAVPVNDKVNDYFDGLKDAILLISSGEKKVSSSTGHELMDHHPFSVPRFEQADLHLEQLMHAMKEEDIDKFIEVTESEALTLHGLMMSSAGSYMLLKPGTVAVIEKIRDFREQTGIPVCFTLDAGPNVHLLYHRMYEDRVFDFINTDLLIHCERGKWIDDERGSGPQRLTDE